MWKKIVTGVAVASCFIVFAFAVRYFVLKEHKGDDKQGVALREIKQDETKKPPKTDKTDKKNNLPRTAEEKKEQYPFEVDASFLKMLKTLREVEVNLDAKETALEQVLDELSSQAGVPIELSEQVKHLSKESITLKLSSMRLEYALHLFCQWISDKECRDYEILIRSGRVLLADKNEAKTSEAENVARLILLAQETADNEQESEKLKKTIKEKKIPLEVAEATLDEVAIQIGKGLGVPAALAHGTDYDRTKRITLVDNTFAEQIIEVVCRHFGVEYYIEDGVLIFCDRFNYDEFARKEEEKKRNFHSFLASFTLKLDAQTDFIRFFKKLSEARNAPRVYPSKPVWLKSPKSSLPAGEYSLKEIFSSFEPPLKVVPLRTEEFHAAVLFLED